MEIVPNRTKALPNDIILKFLRFSKSCFPSKQVLRILASRYGTYFNWNHEFGYLSRYQSYLYLTSHLKTSFSENYLKLWPWEVHFSKHCLGLDWLRVVGVRIPARRPRMGSSNYWEVLSVYSSNIYSQSKVTIECTIRNFHRTYQRKIMVGSKKLQKDWVVPNYLLHV